MPLMRATGPVHLILVYIIALMKLDITDPLGYMGIGEG
jgi:hypothetical protein